MKFQHAYSDSIRTSDLVCDDPSLAQQQFKDDADINVLLERFKVTGQLPQGVVLPSYGDFSTVVDFRSANDAIRRARDSFMELPAALRARFQNDPQVFLEFCSDKANLPELRKLGLAPEAPPEPSWGAGGDNPQVGGSAAAAPASGGGSST